MKKLFLMMVALGCLNSYEEGNCWNNHNNEIQRNDRLFPNNREKNFEHFEHIIGNIMDALNLEENLKETKGNDTNPRILPENCSISGQVITINLKEGFPFDWSKILNTLAVRSPKLGQDIKVNCIINGEEKSFTILNWSKSSFSKFNYRLMGGGTAYKQKIYSKKTLELNSIEGKRNFIENLIKILKGKSIDKLVGDEAIKNLSLRFGLIIRISEHLRSLAAPAIAYMSFYECKNEKDDSKFNDMFNKLFVSSKLTFVGKGGANAVRNLNNEEMVGRLKNMLSYSPLGYIFNTLSEGDKEKLKEKFYKDKYDEVNSLLFSTYEKQKHTFKNDVISTYLAKCNDYESTVFKELTSSREYTKYLFKDALPFYEE